MDRVLGSFSSKDYSLMSLRQFGKGTVFYQFGRKDPFFGKAGKNKYGVPITRKVHDGTRIIQQTVEDPMLFVSNSWDWCADLDIYRNRDILWHDKNVKADHTGKQKSIFDPSPLGWRVPAAQIWGNIHFYNPANSSFDAEKRCVVSTLIPSTRIVYATHGFINNLNQNIDGGNQGVYWTSIPVIPTEDGKGRTARIIGVFSGGVNWTNYRISNGQSIRPIQE